MLFCPTVFSVPRFETAVESARLTMEARFNLTDSFAMLGGFSVVISFGLCSATDFTSFAILLIFDFASIGTVFESGTMNF